MQIENILSAFSKVPFIELYFLGYSSNRYLYYLLVYNTKIFYTSYYLFFVPNNNLFIIGILFNISVIIGKRIIVPINNII